MSVPTVSNDTPGLFQGRAPVLSGPSPFENAPSSAYFPSPVQSKHKSVDSSASLFALASTSSPAHPFDRPLPLSKEEGGSATKTVVASRPTLGPFDSPFTDTAKSSSGADAVVDASGFGNNNSNNSKSNSTAVGSNTVRPSKGTLSDASSMFGAAPQSSFSLSPREGVTVAKENLTAASSLFAPSTSASSPAFQAPSSTYHASPYREANTNSAQNLFSSSPTALDLFSQPSTTDTRARPEARSFDQPPPSVTSPSTPGGAPSFLSGSTMKANNIFAQSAGSHMNTPLSASPRMHTQAQSQGQMQGQPRAVPPSNQFTQPAHCQQSGGDGFYNPTPSPEILLRTRPGPGVRPLPVTYTAPKAMAPQTQGQPVPAAFPSQFQPQSQFISTATVKPASAAQDTSAQSGLPPTGPGVKATTAVKAVKKPATPVPHTPQPAAAVPVPEGMMPTPHGFVSIKKQVVAPVPVPVPTVFTPAPAPISTQGQGQSHDQRHGQSQMHPQGPGPGQGQGQMQGPGQGQGQMYGQGQGQGQQHGQMQGPGQGQGQMYGQGQGQGQMQGQGQGQMYGQGQSQMYGQSQMQGPGQGQGQGQTQGQGQGQMYGQSQIQGQMHGQGQGQGSMYGQSPMTGGDMRNIPPSPSSSFTTPSTTTSEKFMERESIRELSRPPSVGPEGGRDLSQGQGQWAGSDQFSVFNPTEMDVDDRRESVSWTGGRTGVRTETRESEVPKRHQRMSTIAVTDIKGRRNFGRPPCATVCFGFGGKVVVMLPKIKPFLSPMVATPEERAMYVPTLIICYYLCSPPASIFSFPPCLLYSPRFFWKFLS